MNGAKRSERKNMPLRMKEMPELERPYEKLEQYGESKLSNAELLAIIIKSGTKEENSIQIANRILLMTKSVKGLQDISLDELKNIKGIGKVKAVQLKAICELAKRMNEATNIKIQIKEPKDVAGLFMEKFKIENKEYLKLIILNTKNYITKIIDIAQGDADRIFVSPNQILLEVIKAQAKKLIIVHNHPSGDPTPSKMDIEFTRKLLKQSEVLELKLLDHIIIGYDKYESILSRKELER